MKVNLRLCVGGGGLIRNFHSCLTRRTVVGRTLEPVDCYTRLWPMWFIKLFTSIKSCKYHLHARNNREGIEK